MKKLLLLLAASALSAQASLITSYTDLDLAGATTDGTISADEYSTGNSFAFTGGGAGFLGTLGGATMYMNSDAANLYIGFSTLGNPGANQVLIYFNTTAGGFSTVTSDSNGMDDFSDAGRANISRLAADGDEAIPFDADFALLFNQGFSFLADLEDTGPHGVVSHNAAGLASDTPEFSISLADLGLGAGDTLQFTAYLISDTGFMSNEGIPDPGLGSNPGFNTGGNLVLADYNDFTVVPEPSTIGFAALGLLALGRRLRRGA